MKNLFIACIAICLMTFSCKKVEQTSSMQTLTERYQELKKELRSDANWPEFDPAKMNTEKEKLESLLSEFSKLEDGDLSVEDGINKDMLSLVIEDRLESLKFGIHEFPLNAEGGFLTGIVYSINGARLNNQEDQDKFIQKLKELPAYLDARTEHLKSGVFP